MKRFTFTMTKHKEIDTAHSAGSLCLKKIIFNASASIVLQNNLTVLTAEVVS